MLIVVMGVSGSGKSTLGEALSQSLNCDFQEGDALHPAANVEKMRAGIALDDIDRQPWLERVAAWIAAQREQQRDGVVSCSALKRSYRDRLRQADPELRFVYLQLPRVELEQRLRLRNHFMPASLLDSQLRTLQEPAADELALTLDGRVAMPLNVASVRHWLSAAGHT
jgi:gluconokinase